MLAKTTKSKEALHQLFVLEERVRQNDSKLPTDVDLRVRAPKVRCKISEFNLIIRMEDVAEILDVFNLTVIPGCAGWVKGVYNLRGRLLPVYEIRDYFSTMKVAERSTETQIVVVDTGKIFCGIVVDKIYGMQKFYEDEFVEFSNANSFGLGAISKFIDTSIRLENNNWYQLNLMNLSKELHESNPAVAIIQN